MDSGVSIEKLIRNLSEACLVAAVAVLFYIFIRYVSNWAYKAGSKVTEKDLADSNPQIVRKTKTEAGEK